MASPTIVVPKCRECGCTVSSCSQEDYARVRREAEAEHFVPPPVHDGSSVLAAILIALLLLPAAGAKLGDFVFLAPLVVMTFAGIDCGATARRGGARRGVWIWLTGTAALTVIASLLALLSSVLARSDIGGLYVGAGGSAALLVSMIAMARVTMRDAPLDRIVDGALICIVLISGGAYFVAVKGFAHGDVLLTLVFVLDLLATAVGVLSFAARPSSRHRRVAAALIGVSLAASVGDGLAAAGAAHLLQVPPSDVALLWTIAALLLGLASSIERRPASEWEDVPAEDGSGWIWMRVVVPLACVLTFPAIAAVLALSGRMTVRSAIYLGALLVATLVVAFARQVYLLIDNQRAVVRERRLRADAVRRNGELEALTSLATTMTESLEETPIMERGLAVLHLAARASSSALEVLESGDLTIAATAGNWQAERVWVSEPRAVAEAGIQERGGRIIVRLPLQARGHEIGRITLMRPAAARFAESELQLLRLLVGQLAIALQNARDYRERLDQAIRDPLTGVYNRRFFYETLGKELHRTERFGSEVSIVLFDVDNFKAINDTFGHSAGDEALRRVAQIATDLLRPTDSFARLGGEEFGLLLPETHQLDALLVAERLRTAIARNSILPNRRVTVSGGVSSCPQDAGELDKLISRADAALYWAKRNGRNLCTLAGEVVLESEQEPAENSIAHLHAMVSAIDAQHLLTKDHSENVASYAVAVGQALGLHRERIVKLRRAALLHDIGKAAVSRDILEKPAKLTDEEFEQIKLHPSAGATMLCHSGLIEEADWIRHHHERMDGRGYPDGLSGRQIPLEARILHIVDAFEAMTSDRPYHKGIPVEDALAELQRCAGTQFDGRIVGTLATLVQEQRLTILATAR